MKKITTSLLATALVAPLFMGATAVKAAGEVVAQDDSEAHVTMVKRKTTDPEDNDGPLRLESISTINFGNQYISGSTAIYNARYTEADKVAEGEYTPTTIIVNDDRGTNQGWSLQATATDFSTDKVGVDPEAKSLVGAFITLKDGQGNAPGSEESALENPGANIIPASIKLVGTDVLIATAEKEEANAAGVGRTSVSFGAIGTEVTEDKPSNLAGNNKVVLTIPGKSKKAEDATYTSTITWTLLDDPAIK